MATSPGEKKRPIRRRVRISIGLLCLLVAGIALGLARIANEARRQRRAIETIDKLGGYYDFDYQFVGAEPNWEKVISDAQPPGPAWLRRWIGEEPFRDVVGVRFDGPRWRDEDLAILDDLPHLRQVTLWGTHSTDAGLGHLRRQRHLKLISVVSETIGDGAMAHLSGLTTLESVDFVSGAITDAGVEQLLGLKNLRALNLESTQLTDAGLARLVRLPKLEVLGIQHTKVSIPGVRSFTKARPDVFIITERSIW